MGQGSIKIWILAFLGKYSNIFVGSQSVSIEVRIILRPNKQYWNNCPRKLKFRFLIENPDPTFVIEMRTKGISITPWPSDYNWITNQRYKVWTPQGRIPDKFTVLEEPKEEQSLTFSDFLFNSCLYYNECMLLIRHD